ncbi:hypothetical protein CH300_12335 [Rhodococcus sp. 15-1154-1]|nr:hypothetical protein [Rhodococcus sp. 15-1154-1]OZF06004.1 hypothetical protein CH300_12335 [Rhodococcus sp. 15-1154-1]
MMTKTRNTRIKTFAYALAGLAAFAGLLALLIWTITPTERAGDIAPQSPVDVTSFLTIVAGAAAFTFLVIIPIFTLLVPKLTRSRIHLADDRATGD